MKHSEYLIWMDLEMTGLDPEIHRIIEMATIITDTSLNMIAEGPALVVKQPKAVLAAMDEWNTEHHTASGLLDRIRDEGISTTAAEQMTLAFVKKYVAPGLSPLCGNSIGQDRRFLMRYMPRLEVHLHYRSIDVSTVKELAMRWRPDIFAGIVKKQTHRALDDIKESLAELRYYQQHFFNHQLERLNQG